LHLDSILPLYREESEEHKGSRYFATQANIIRLMPISSFEIRVCLSCGLRYPLAEGHSFGQRCPQCLGETQVKLKKEINTEPAVNDDKKIDQQHTLAVLVDNIRSAWNVGSILRSADGFGFTHAYLCGITPTPEQEAVQKTSLGAEDFVTWSQHKDAVKLVKGFKKEGWKVIALEEDKRAVSIRPAKTIRDYLTSAKNIVLIVGSEVTGLDPELLDLADEIFYIPMHGQKRSFNVANAFSIAAYALSS
jgi:23S rRNA (guanosine2251-2'-O)-methyltransferase